MDASGIKIRCDDESYGKKCDKTATHIIRLTHMRNTCDPQTIALCNNHIGGWIYELKKYQNAVYQHAPTKCKFCRAVLKQDSVVGTFIQLLGKE